MTIEHSPYSADSPPKPIFEYPERRTVASYERELIKQRCTELRLREQSGLSYSSFWLSRYSDASAASQRL